MVKSMLSLGIILRKESSTSNLNGKELNFKTTIIKGDQSETMELQHYPSLTVRNKMCWLIQCVFTLQLDYRLPSLYIC